MNEYLIVGSVFLCGVCLFGVVLCAYLLHEIAELKGAMKILQSAPVLRQYIERYVPVDNSEEAQKKMEAKMTQMESEFDKMFAIPSSNKAKKVDMKPEELV